MCDTRFNPAWIDRSPTVKVYKDDARSRVWQIYCPLGQVVIKQFRHAPFKQFVSRLVGMHPAQREYRVYRRMARAGLPVARIHAMGRHRDGVYLASEFAGQSIYNLLYNQEISEFQQRRALCEAVGTLTGRTLAAGWVIRDYKASNIVALLNMPEEHRLHLIDVGSGRRSRSMTRILRMITTLDANAVEAGASKTDRLRTLKAAIRQYPKLGNLKTVARAIVRKQVQ